MGQEGCLHSKSLGKKDEESYDFDISKAEKIFDYLLEHGKIKLPPNHVIPPPAELKNRRYYKYHNGTSHHTNDCRVFR